MLPTKEFWDMTIIAVHKYKIEDTELWLIALAYIHQLQNLYFALTGKELELTPTI